MKSASSRGPYTSINKVPLAPGIEATEFIGPAARIAWLDIDHIPRDVDQLKRVAEWAAARDVVMIVASRLDDDPRDVWEVPAVRRDYVDAIDRIVAAGLPPRKIHEHVTRIWRFCRSLEYPANAR